MSFRRKSCALAALVVLALVVPGCASRGGSRAPSPGSTDAAPVGELSLDRGAWLVGTSQGIWTVQVPGDAPSSPPRRLGYVVARAHREVRGGPSFTVYEVYGLDRSEQVGFVDSLGNAKRFEPRRNGHIEVVDAGNSTLELSVQAIFQTMKPVTLDATTERRLAFEALDVNHDGMLDRTEMQGIGSAYGNPDTNRDGKVDWSEFDAAERL